MDDGFDGVEPAAPAVALSHLADLCRQYVLRVVEILPGRAGASVAVIRVQSNDGEHFVLKQTASVVGSGEIAVLRAASASGVTPRLKEEVEPGVYLAEWLPGRSLADIPPSEPIDAAAIGRALRTFHQIGPPSNLTTITNGFFHWRSAGWRALPLVMRARGDELSASLDAYEPPAPVLLHGDLAPTNVLVTPDGPRLIDPAGLRGLASWDLAQLAVTAAGRGRHGIVSALVNGYGEEPAYLAETVAWMVLHYFDKNLAVANSPFTPQLQPLAEMVVSTGDASRVLEGHMQ